MGATLPVLVARCERGALGAGLARLYAINTFGAVAGSVLGGFLLLPALGLAATTFVAAALNIIAAALAWWSPATERDEPRARAEVAATTRAAADARAAHRVRDRVRRQRLHRAAAAARVDPAVRTGARLFRVLVLVRARHLPARPGTRECRDRASAHARPRRRVVVRAAAARDRAVLGRGDSRLCRLAARHAGPGRAGRALMGRTARG